MATAQDLYSKLIKHEYWELRVVTMPTLSPLVALDASAIRDCTRYAFSNAWSKYWKPWFQMMPTLLSLVTPPVSPMTTKLASWWLLIFHKETQAVIASINLREDQLFDLVPSLMLHGVCCCCSLRSGDQSKAPGRCGDWLPCLIMEATWWKRDESPASGALTAIYSPAWQCWPAKP